MTPGHRDLRSASRNMSGCFRKPSANETCTVQRPLQCHEDRASGESRRLDVAGIFVRIGFCASASWLPSAAQPIGGLLRYVGDATFPRDEVAFCSHGSEDIRNHVCHVVVRLALT